MKSLSMPFLLCRRMSLLVIAMALLLGAAAVIAADPSATSPAAGDIDWNRARSLHQREMRGEKLSPEDQAYVDRAKALLRARQQGQGNNAPGAAPKESTGLVPLTQFKADQKYKEMAGGLYGNGCNEPPEAQRKAALAAAAQIVPLDPAGKPAPDGKIVLMSIGMSNTTQEFSRFKQIADADPEKSPSLVIVDGAQGGKDAAAWTINASDTGNPVWDTADARGRSVGTTRQQVQVVWIKQALIQPAKFGEFPAHAKVLQDHIQKILSIAKTRYPNLRLAYLSSRIYAGYARTQLNPEPYSYEGAFAVRWVIEDQINGSAKLNYDPAKGPVTAPVVLWGPYLWTDGTKGRQIDDVVWKQEDCGPDGTHPSDTGRAEVAQMLLKFCKTDPTAKSWFLKSGSDKQ